MKHAFHKIMSILMAFVVLLSTMSFTVDLHYCGDTLVATAIFKKVEPCGLEMQNPSDKECSILKKNCCSDKQLVVDGQDELQLVFDSISLEKQVCVTLFMCAYNNLFEGLEKNPASSEEYKPPRLLRQLYKMDESYLI